MIAEIVLAGSAWLTSPMAPAQADDPFRAETRAWIESNPAGATYRFPQPTAASFWPNRQVPKAVLDDADQWIRKCVRSEWLVPSLRGRLVGSRAPTSDRLYCRYEPFAGGNADLFETERLLVVAFDFGMSDVLGSEHEVLSHVREALFTVLKLDTTAQKEAAVAIRKTHAARADLTVFTGVAEIGAEGLRPWEREWWSRIEFLTDGRTVAFVIAKAVPGNAGGAQTGTAQIYRGRFGTG